MSSAPSDQGVHPTCDAAVNPRHGAVDLDRGTARLDSGDAGEPFVFKLAPGGVEVFDIVARTETCDCRWWLKLGFARGAERRSAQMGDAPRAVQVDVGPAIDRRALDGYALGSAAPPGGVGLVASRGVSNRSCRRR